MNELNKYNSRKIRGGYRLPNDYQRATLLVEGDDALNFKKITRIFGTYLSYDFDDIRLQSLFSEPFEQISEASTESKQAMEILKTYMSPNHILHIVTVVQLSDDKSHALIRVLKREDGYRIRDIIAVADYQTLVNFVQQCPYSNEELPNNELLNDTCFQDKKAYKIHQPGFNYDFHIIKLNEII